MRARAVVNCKTPTLKMRTSHAATGGISAIPLLSAVRKGGFPLKVARRVVPNGKAEIVLANGDKVPLHPFALVGKMDSVARGPGGEIYVVLPEGRGFVQVSPAWRMRRDISVFGRKAAVVVKEIETEEELAGYESLTRHHYRSGAGATRRAPLIAKINAPDLPEVVGFVEITSCFLVNVARRKILDAPFSDAGRDIKWERWDMDTAKKHTNVVARISRCVVYPELRGVGVAGVLAEAAKQFATKRWHIGGWRPVFMEITAEMLRYWPFVEKAGFVKVGDTEGNGDRVEKSMAYLLRRKRGPGFPAGGGGILTMYRAHANTLAEVISRRSLPASDVIGRIKKSPESLSAKDWVALNGLYRRPKPVYMLGLTEAARKILPDAPPRALPASPLFRGGGEGAVHIRKMSVRASWEPETSRGARRVQEAFGIVAERLETKIAEDLDVRVASGEILLVAGASGSGKSLLLRALAWHASGRLKKWAPPPEIQTEAAEVKPVKVSMMAHPNPRMSPVALLKKNGLGLEQAMRMLASAGLGEAQLFVRPSGTLSSGQRYRLSLALALAKKPDLLLVDEFCESLDDYSAAAVCRRLRKEAVRSSIAVVAATVNGARICPELRPMSVLRLLPNRRHKWEKLA